MVTPKELALIIWFNTHHYAESWTEQIAMEWLEEFITLHLEEAEKRGRDSLTPSHDAQEAKDRLTQAYGDIEVDINSP